MQPALTGSLAVIGLLAGWPQRALITRLTLPGARIWPEALLPGAVTAVLLAALAVRLPGGWVLAAACWLVLCAVPLILTDLAVSRLPDPLTAAAWAGTTLLLLLAAAVNAPHSSWSALLRAVLGGLALAAFYLLLVIISPNGMGLGDVKLAAGLGTLLAWFGWRVLLAGGAAGFLLGGLGAAAWLAVRGGDRKQLMAFGPFMIAGAVLAVLTQR